MLIIWLVEVPFGGGPRGVHCHAPLIRAVDNFVVLVDHLGQGRKVDSPP